MMMSRRLLRFSAVICLTLTVLMGIAAPAVHAVPPQPFAGNEITALVSQEALSPYVADVTCGMSDDVKNGVGLGLGVLALLIGVVMLASVASSAN